MDGTQYRQTIVSSGKLQIFGLYGDPNGDKGAPLDSCEFIVQSGAASGNNAMPDAVAGTGTQVVIPNGMVPKGCRCYVTLIALVPSTAFSGGTAGTVSLTVQGNGGTALATYTQGALATAGTYGGLPASVPPAGVTDVNGAIALMTAATSVGQGLSIVLANSTAGVARFRIRGYFAP